MRKPIDANTKLAGADATLKTGNTYIYVFHDYMGFNTYFDAAAPNNFTSVTFQADPDATIGYTYPGYLNKAILARSLP
jgi:hypothetical protein